MPEKRFPASARLLSLLTQNLAPEQFKNSNLFDDFYVFELFSRHYLRNFEKRFVFRAKIPYIIMPIKTEVHLMTGSSINKYAAIIAIRKTAVGIRNCRRGNNSLSSFLE